MLVFFFFLTRLNHVIDLLDVFQEMLEKKKILSDYHR